MIHPVMGLSSSHEEDPDVIHDIFHVTDTFVDRVAWQRQIKQYMRHQEGSDIPYFSVGSSPYTIYVVRQPEQKSKIRDISYDQPQLTLCHTIFVLCTRTDFVLSVENLVEESLERQSIRQFLNQFWNPYQPDKTAWAKHQTYMAAGYAAVACEQEGFSCSIIDGFQVQALHDLLQLPSYLIPTTMLVVGAPD
jgi:nitroreductase